VVESCVNFLNHPKVKNAQLSHKKDFLRKKGLSEDEITEAIKRADTYSQPIQQTQQFYPQNNSNNNKYPQQPFNPQNYNSQFQNNNFQNQNQNQFQQQQMPPRPPQPQLWYRSGWGLTSAIVSVAAIGVGIGYVAKHYLLPMISKKSEISNEEKEKQKKIEEEKQSQIKSNSRNGKCSSIFAISNKRIERSIETTE